MIVETGHLALALALAVALLQATLPMIGAQRGWADYMRLGPSAAIAQFILLAVAFGALTQAFLTTDLSVKLVAGHSHELKPLLYKIAGVWGNHEGSMLLWSLTLALFGALIAWFGRNLPLALRARTLAVQGMIGAAFLAFIIFTSNPFWRFPLGEVPFEGADLNPVLQDPGLAFHPPFLYLGYVGLSTSFSFAVAALIEGRVDAAWARWVRPWTLAAWVFLTIGIALGSYWAYYELGWGGYWFWDPVENASFMPWLAAAALFHSAIVVEKRGELKSWTILLAILAFGLSLIGTFLVRSGVITSVHAFASDPTRGVFILLILAAALGGALALFGARAHKLSSDGLFAPVSRESALLFNNLLLAVSTVAVFIGTLSPIFYEAMGKTITVGAPYFDWVFGLLMLPLLLVLPIGAMLPWKRGEALRAMSRLTFAAGLAIVGVLLAASLTSGQSALAPLGVGLAAWVVFGALTDVFEKVRLGRAPAAESLRRLINLPRADWGKLLGHAGLGLTVLGITIATSLESEDVRLAIAGDTYVVESPVGAYTFTFNGVVARPGPNYNTEVAQIDVVSPGGATGTLYPERRWFPVQRTNTSEVALDHGFTRDIYVVLGDKRPDGAWSVRTYVKPFVVWIWLGSLVMAGGGVLSLSDRRFRIGAPAGRKAAKPETQEARA